MAAFTSKATGNWSAAGQTTWNEVGVPADGDTVTIASGHVVTVDVNTEVGANSGVGTPAITVAGELITASSVTLISNGDIDIDNGVHTMQAGSIMTWGNSTGVRYGWQGVTVAQTSSRVVMSGTSVSHCTVNKEAAAGTWFFSPSSTASNSHIGMSADYTDFVDGGTALSAFNNGTTNGWAINISTSGATQEARLNKCTLTSCGTLTVQNCAATRHIDIDIKIEKPLNAIGTVFNVFIDAAASTTGHRNLRIVGRHSYVAIATTRTNYVINNVIVARLVDGAAITGLPTSVQNILINSRYLNLSSFGSVGETITNVGGFLDAATSVSNYFMQGPAPSGTGTITYDNFVCQDTSAWEENDLFAPSSPGTGGPFTYHLKRWINILNSRGLPGGSLHSAHGSSLTTSKITHCTAGFQDNQSPSARAWFFVNHGADFPGHSAMIDDVRSNLIYSPTVLVSPGGWVVLHYSQSLLVPLASVSMYGTAAGTSISTRIDCTGKAWSTAVGQRFSDAGAVVVITGQSGTGPPVGETRTISSNTAATITVSVAFSATPDTGTTFKIYVLDSATASQIGYNAYYNAVNGTVYGPDGYSTSRVVKGYEGMVLTDVNAIGVNDIDLGSGTDIEGAGPMFRDTERGFHNYANRYLGPAGVATTPSDWLTATGYVVGDRVKAQTSAWFANEVLWYRCIVAHTSGASTKPGSGANWRTNWEFDFLSAVSDFVYADTLVTDPTLSLTNASYIEHVFAWIRYGWTPMNTTLRNAGHDGEDIGAVDVGSTGVGQNILLLGVG